MRTCHESVQGTHSPSLFFCPLPHVPSRLSVALQRVFTRAFAYLVPVGLDEAVRVHAGHAVIGGGVAGSAPLTVMKRKRGR